MKTTNSHIDLFAVAHDAKIPSLTHGEASALLAIRSAADSAGVDIRDCTGAECQIIASCLELAGGAAATLRGISASAVSALIRKGGF